MENITKGKGISERVADYIKGRIRNGTYQSGERILAEREMAEQLGVSRNTVRESYKILEAYGYLKAEHGKGFYITSESEQIRKMTESFIVSTSQIKDLFNIRKVLEDAAVVWAIENGTAEHLEELESIIKKADHAITHHKSVLVLAEYDLQFHLCLAEMSGNEVAYRIMHHLIDLLAQVRSKSIKIPNRARQSVEEHKQILAAIKDKDVKLAKQLMRQHLVSVETAIARQDKV